MRELELEIEKMMSGSVVVHDIPNGVLAAGNPCRVIKKIDSTE